MPEVVEMRRRRQAYIQLELLVCEKAKHEHACIVFVKQDLLIDSYCEEFGRLLYYCCRRHSNWNILKMPICVAFTAHITSWITCLKVACCLRVLNTTLPPTKQPMTDVGYHRDNRIRAYYTRGEHLRRVLYAALSGCIIHVRCSVYTQWVYVLNWTWEIIYSPRVTCISFESYKV